MNIQIYGRSKCFDTKKAERYFKERRIKYQYIDLGRFGMSVGELKSVAAAVGLPALIDGEAKQLAESMIPYLNSAQSKLERLAEWPQVIKTPVVRNGRQATVGYQPDVWKSWE